jgi:hypothetical protein
MDAFKRPQEHIQEILRLYLHGSQSAIQINKLERMKCEM